MSAVAIARLIVLCINYVSLQLLVGASEGRLEGHTQKLVPPSVHWRMLVSFTTAVTPHTSITVSVVSG